MKRQRRTVWELLPSASDLRNWGAGVLALALVAGCGGLWGLTKDTPADVKAAAVKERSNARWAALIKGDMDAAYAYLSPGTRELVSPEQYRARIRSIGYRAVKIEKVDCESETCKVGLLLTYDYTPTTPTKGGAGVKGVSTYVEETWVLEKGQAWYVWRP
jgi:hypothetical protein